MYSHSAVAWGVLLFVNVVGVYGQHQHADDFIVGVSGGPSPQLVFELDEEIASGAGLLAPDAWGGYSTDVPGFEALPVSEPDEGIYTLGAGARIWLQIHSPVTDPGVAELMISPALFVFDPLSTTFFPHEEGGTLYREVFLGADDLHTHLLWFLDPLDPAYDPGQCVWELTARFIDRGSTGYAPSAPFTLRFALHRIVPGDFDCDGDVDGDDLMLFEDCAGGPAIPLDSACARYDLDGDHDADATDFAVIQRCFSGSGVPGNPECAKD